MSECSERLAGFFAIDDGILECRHFASLATESLEEVRLGPPGRTRVVRLWRLGQMVRQSGSAAAANDCACCPTSRRVSQAA